MTRCSLSDRLILCPLTLNLGLAEHTSVWAYPLLTGRYSICPQELEAENSKLKPLWQMSWRRRLR